MRLLNKIVNAKVGETITYKVNGKTVKKRITALLKKRANLARTFKKVNR